MKFIGIVGSPRAGNTEFIVKEILDKLNRMGAQTRLFLLIELTFGYCQACWKCLEDKRCQIKDDLTDIVFSEMLSSQGMIFASPSFYGSVSGLMKNFMDRCTPFLNSYNPGPLRGKVSANLIVYGREGGVYCSQATLDYWCLTMGIKVIHNSLFLYLHRNDASKSIYLGNETDLIAMKLMAAIDEKWQQKGAEDYPRLLVSENSITPAWRTPTVKKRKKKGNNL